MMNGVLVNHLRRSVAFCAVTLALVTGAAGCTGKAAKSTTSSPATATGLAGGDGETGSTAAPSSSRPPTHPPSTPRTTAPTVGAPITETVVDACPYIDTQAAADAEGNRIGQVSVLKRGAAVMGCRFRFAYGDNHYTLEITSQRYADAITAYNAMVRQGSAGKNAAGDKLSTGESGIRYRTPFYGRDGDQDWAFVFVKGVTVVTVKTDQDDVSQNAVSVAELIVAKF